MHVSAARHGLVPASLLPFPDFSQSSGIHGTKRQTSPTPSTDRSRWRPPVLAAAAALSPSWARRHRSRRTPRQLLVEVTAVEDGMSCGCEGAQAALGSSLALRRIAERSSDRSAAGSPSPVRRDAARRPRCKLRPRFEAHTATRCIPARPVPPASSPGPPGVALRTTLTHGRAAPACRLDCPHGNAGSVAPIHPTRAGPLTLPHPLR